MEDKSKSEKKREMSALQDLGKRLLELSEDQLQEIGIPQELHDALKLARDPEEPSCPAQTDAVYRSSHAQDRHGTYQAGD